MGRPPRRPTSPGDDAGAAWDKTESRRSRYGSGARGGGGRAGRRGSDGRVGRRGDGEPGAERDGQAHADADPEAVARSICLAQLDHAPRTRGQLADAMRRRLVPDDVAERVLLRLEEVGLVDDVAFAGAWVQSRHRSKGLAGSALGRELRTRGVDDETVSAAVAELDVDTELATATDLARRRQRSIASLPVATQQRRLVSMLGRKGYPAGLVYRVVREVIEDDRRYDAEQSVTGAS